MERTLELESEDLRCVIQYGTWNKAVNLLGLNLLCTRRMISNTVSTSQDCNEEWESTVASWESYFRKHSAPRTWWQ